MSFVHPTFLWALALLAIPIIIHLFNFRRYRKVEFSNVKMLKKVETQSRKTRQLKKYLILLSRLLAMAALVLAFAQPYVSKGQEGKAEGILALYIDNSQSMSAMGSEGQLFETAKEGARELIKSMPTQTDFLLFSNNRSALKYRKSAEALAYVDQLSLSSIPNALSQRLQAVKAWMPNKRQKIYCYAFSDFQKEPSFSPLDSAVSVYPVPVRAENTDNLSIDSIWLASPVNRLDQPIELKVLLSNHGNKVAKGVNLSLLVQGKNQQSISLDIPAGKSMVHDLQFGSSERGWLKASVLLNDPNFLYDNRYYFSVYLKEQLKVLQLGLDGKSFQGIFQDDYILWQGLNPLNLDYDALKDYDLIVLNELDALSEGLQTQLLDYMRSGGGIFFVPSTEFKSAQWSELGVLSARGTDKPALSIDPAGLEHPFYNSVYERIPKAINMPKVNRQFLLNGENANTILKTKDGKTVLAERRIGRGKLFQLAFPLSSDWSQLSEHELLVISSLRMLFSLGSTEQLAHTLHQDQAIELQGMDLKFPLELRGENGAVLVQGSREGVSSFWLNPLLDQAGQYGVYMQDQDEELAVISLNTATSESKMNFLSASELADEMEVEVGKELNSTQALLQQAGMGQGKALWKLFVLFCLIFLLLEILLLRFLKS